MTFVQISTLNCLHAFRCGHPYFLEQFIVITCNGSVCTPFVILFVICKPYKAQQLYSAYKTATVVLFLAGLK